MGADDCEITYRPNAFNDAKMVFPDSTSLYTNVFSTEQEVQLYIGNPATTGVKMLHGFIDEVKAERNPDRERNIICHMVDWGAYLAAKRNYEKKIIKTKRPDQVVTGTLSTVTDGVDTLTGTNVNVVAGTVKQEFEGTAVKDVWNMMAEVGNADYFVSEDLDLYFFESGSKLLQTGGTTYRIQDIPSAAASQIAVDQKKPYSFTQDRINSYRNVKVVSGLKEAFPPIGELDRLQVLKYFDGETTGKEFSQYYQMGLTTDYDVDAIGNSFGPCEFNSAEVVDPTLNKKGIPTLRLNVASASQDIDVQMIGRTASTISNFDIPVNDWEEVSFYMYNGLARSAGSITSIKLVLEDFSVAGGWTFDITSHVTGANAGAWKYFRLTLPTTTSNSESYSGSSWTKIGSPTKVQGVSFDFTPGTGYTPNSYLKFAQFFFYRRANYSVTNSGNPPTQKIVVNKAIKNSLDLATFGVVEAARVNREFKKAFCTIPGNTNFKKPAYSCEVDFSNTLGTGRSGLSPNFLRMENIRHYLQEGVHYTELNFNYAFDRT